MILRSENRSENGLALALVLTGVLMRLLPHPWNFTPVTAIALFSGVVLAPRLAFFLPLLIMIASDLLIGPHPLYPLTWGAFAAVTLLGYLQRMDSRVGRLLASVFSGSLLFFVVTNLGVFLFQNMYEKSWAGLVQCYLMALPFFRNTLFGDLFYSAVLFGVFAAVKVASRRPVTQKIR